jgi:hypothetical protein
VTSGDLSGNSRNVITISATLPTLTAAPPPVTSGGAWRSIVGVRYPTALASHVLRNIIQSIGLAYPYRDEFPFIISFVLSFSALISCCCFIISVPFIGLLDIST